MSLRVIIVGGGIVGASAAYELSRRGASVTLVDNARPDRATQAGAGIIAPISTLERDLTVSAYSFEATRHYFDLIDALAKNGTDTSFYKTKGELLVALDEAEEDRLAPVYQRAKDLVGRFGSAGVGEVQMLGRTAIRERFPLFETAHGAVFLSDIGQIDGRHLTRNLLAQAVAAGTQTIQGTAKLITGDGAVKAVSVADERIEADMVLLAAGAWSTGLAREIGLNVAVYPQRGQILHLHLAGASAMPAANSFRHHYLLSFDEDRLVIGATREDDSGFSADITAGGIAQVIRQGSDFIPKIAQATLIEIRVGMRPVSRDGNPFLGPVVGMPGLWLGLGMGPQGLTLGPYSGAVLARRMLGEDIAIPDPFSAERPLAA